MLNDILLTFSLVVYSDNFSFQNYGIKKCTCWKTMGFSGKQWVFWENNVVFLKSNVFLHDFTHDLF